ncbi:exonuclease [uncultured Roseibium sp.]|uniref:exonuclease n=1 Tax=uncultured Roseibium sp. TaxID=1936171 RepID=UPI002630F36B|nr:exonuclease [uncultured Roseibium sp.]
MSHTIVFDSEFLTAPGAKGRMWCGPLDPDPCVAQIGAVKLSLEPGFRVLETERVFIKTADRYGKPTVADPFFTELTGITQAQIDAEGVRPEDAHLSLARIAGDATLWSWGKDEMFLMAVSCYVAGVAPPIPAHRFGNAASLLNKAGMPLDDIGRTTSGELAQYFGLPIPPGRHHDALDDAMSITVCLQHLLRTGRLDASDFELPSPKAGVMAHA